MASAPELVEILKKHFHWESFRKGQLEVIQSALGGRDALAVMPTGSGKSLCYQVPALAVPGIVVVVSPLIALMKDQVRHLRKLGLPAGSLHSGQSLSEKQQIFSEMQRQPNFILYLSPERVQKPGFGQWVKDRPISLFAIDEAHCVSQWGPDFRPDYHRLSLLRELRPEVPILALTATATPVVLEDVVTQLSLRKPDRHIHGFYRPNLYYQVEACEDDFEKLERLKQGVRQTPEGRILIYCGTRKQTEALFTELGEEVPDIGFYHAGLDAETRSRVQRDYEEKRIRVLAATNAFGMGIDHPDIRLVVHYQMPANIESLYQEMGRAGRDGKSSTCLLLYSRKDKSLHSYFIKQSKAPEFNLKQRWTALNTLIHFAEGGECRHAGILTYFRDSYRLRKCQHCDICDPDSDRKVQSTEISRPLSRPKRKKARSRSQPLWDEPLTSEAEVRQDVLKQWRRQYAESRDIAAFIVFSNKTLRELAARAPQTLDELEKIYGMGPQKISAFGAELLGEIRKCEEI